LGKTLTSGGSGLHNRSWLTEQFKEATLGGGDGMGGISKERKKGGRSDVTKGARIKGKVEIIMSLVTESRGEGTR